jgi:hypothetical protein
MFFNIFFFLNCFLVASEDLHFPVMSPGSPITKQKDLVVKAAREIKTGLETELCLLQLQNITQQSVSGCRPRFS